MNSKANVSATTINEPFTLANGQVIKNRLLKSAMSEALGTTDNRPTSQLATLYRRWSQGGCGVLVTGNIMIDRKALGEPNNVAVEDEQDLPLLKSWAAAATENDTQCWVQLNHPGKQSPKGLNKETVSPSAVPFNDALKGYFDTPRELSHAEIEDIIERFGRSAEIVKKAGFTGVQIHGAHGYLVSQFLSPHHNQRTDQWGGSAENRRAFVLAVYRRMREGVGKDFPISIKLNSADFQKGGFTEEESLDVIKALVADGIDLVEISGGTYESPVMSGVSQEGTSLKQSTIEREAYFLQFADKVRQAVNVPLAVTGGFRTTHGMNQALQDDSLDFVGIARPVALDPEFANALLNGKPPTVTVRPVTTGIKMVDQMALMEVAWYSRQLKLLAKGKETKPNENYLLAFFKIILGTGVRTFKTRRLRA